MYDLIGYQGPSVQYIGNNIIYMIPAYWQLIKSGYLFVHMKSLLKRRLRMKIQKNWEWNKSIYY